MGSPEHTEWAPPRIWGAALGRLSGWLSRRSETPNLDQLLEQAAARGSVLLAPLDEAGPLALAGRARASLALPTDRTFDATAAAFGQRGVSVIRGLQGLAARRGTGAAQPVLIPVDLDGKSPANLGRWWPGLVRVNRPIDVLRQSGPAGSSLSAGLTIPLALTSQDRPQIGATVEALSTQSASASSIARRLIIALREAVPEPDARGDGAGLPVPASLQIYRAAMTLLSPLAPIYLARRRARGKEDKARIEERYGRSKQARPPGTLIWMHAASVGESISILPLISTLLEQKHCDHVLVTTGTTTSAEVMAKRLPDGASHAFVPLDVPRYASRFLDHWRPDTAVFAESEIWPSLQLALRKRAIPLAIVNGRMSKRSLDRWGRVPSASAMLMGQTGSVLAQTSGDANRFAALGARRVSNVGNIKFDVPAPEAKAEDVDVLDEAIRMRPLWLAASTHEGEDDQIAEAHIAARDRFPDLLSIIVPRHPERAEAIAKTLQDRWLETARRSRDEPITARIDVYLADTIGELGLFYRIAPVALIAGSMVPIGGHNPIEAALLDCAVIHGPHVTNFKDMYEAFDACGGATKIQTPADLTLQLIELLSNEEARTQMIAAAHSEIERHAGAVERTLNDLRPMVPRADAA